MAARARSKLDAAFHRVPPCPVSCWMQRSVDTVCVNCGSATLPETQGRHAVGQLRLGGVLKSADA